MTAEAKDALYAEVTAIAEVLTAAGVRTETDFRDGYSPGWKFNDWELKGIPLRIEFGPKDSERHVVTTSRRDVADKEKARGEIAISDLKTKIPELLETIQADMFKKADAEYKARRIEVTAWDDFVPALNAKNVILVPHCHGDKCEDEIKEMSARKEAGDLTEVDAKAPSMGAKSLCIPFEQPKGLVEGETKCVNPNCKGLAKSWVLFGRSY